MIRPQITNFFVAYHTKNISVRDPDSATTSPEGAVVDHLRPSNPILASNRIAKILLTENF